MAKRKAASKENGGAALGFEAQLWAMADKLRGPVVIVGDTLHHKASTGVHCASQHFFLDEESSD